MARSTKKIMVSSKNFNFMVTALLTDDPKNTLFCIMNYFGVVLSCEYAIGVVVRGAWVSDNNG